MLFRTSDVNGKTNAQDLNAFRTSRLECLFAQASREERLGMSRVPVPASQRRRPQKVRRQPHKVRRQKGTTKAIRDEPIGIAGISTSHPAEGKTEGVVPVVHSLPACLLAA